MKEYGIVYLLPKSVRNYHADLRLKIEKKFKLTGNTKFNSPSHITMKYRFSAENIEEVEKVLEKFSKLQVKTKWLLKGFNYFNNSTIFMDVFPAKETREAHSKLINSLRKVSWMKCGMFDNANLHYHVTLAHQGITPDNFQRVWSFVKQQGSPEFKLFFDNLALLQINEEIHTVYKKYLLLDDGADFPRSKSFKNRN